MRDFKRRMIIRSILYSPITAGILIVVIIFAAHSTIKVFGTYMTAKKEYAAALDAFTKLQKREASLKAKIEALETERGIEEEIRNKFGFAKEGEEVIVIVEPPTTVATSSTRVAHTSNFLGFLKTLFNF